MCDCPRGYKGHDCSIQVDKCKNEAANVCQHGGICVSTSLTLDGYECKCLPGYMGKHCQLVDVCEKLRPCKHNSTCISLATMQRGGKSIREDEQEQEEEEVYPKYSCQCSAGFTGINCDVRIKCKGTLVTVL